MFLCRPKFRKPEVAVQPPNLVEAQDADVGGTPVQGDSSDFAADVETPSGEVLAIDDAALVETLAGIERQLASLDLSRYPHLPRPFVAATRIADCATLLAGGATYG